MTQNLLRKLYADELKDLYSAGTQVVRASPKMAKVARSPALRAGFEGHLRQTWEHVACAAKIFEALDESPKGKHGKGLEALINEGSDMIAEAREPEE
jgi:ferritin-like metal-binding protein YciE